MAPSLGSPEIFHPCPAPGPLEEWVNSPASQAGDCGFEPRTVYLRSSGMEPYGAHNPKMPFESASASSG